MTTLILDSLAGANGNLILAGLVAGAAVAVFGVALAAEWSHRRTLRANAAEAIKTLWYAANKAVAAR